jgi:hypothetical protein
VVGLGVCAYSPFTTEKISKLDIHSAVKGQLFPDVLELPRERDCE